MTRGGDPFFPWGKEETPPFLWEEKRGSEPKKVSNEPLYSVRK